MADWHAHAYQFVWFSARAQEADASSVFSAVLGSDAEVTQRSRTITPKAPFFSTAESNLDGTVARVTVQPGRVDLYLQPYVDSEASQPFVLLADVREILSRIKANFVPAAAQIQDVARLAFLTTLLAPASTVEESSALVLQTSNLPYRRKDGYTDVTLQLNRRKLSGVVEGLELNRLLRLMSLQAQMTFVVADAGGPPAGVPVPAGHAGHWLIDINSVPSATPFSAELQDAIFQEIWVESDRIRAAGSVNALQD